ncbi:unnamed protein product [Amoebophrya sp. A120]|nr:unnamed protein product [Amoebophrya sp. A120]|eukprot:GSA120T00022131001.1
MMSDPATVSFLRDLSAPPEHAWTRAADVADWMTRMQQQYDHLTRQNLLDAREREKFQIVKRQVEQQWKELQKQELLLTGGGGGKNKSSSSSSSPKNSDGINSTRQNDSHDSGNQRQRNQSEREELTILKQRTQQATEQMSLTQKQLEKQAEKLTEMQQIFADFDFSLQGAGKAMLLLKAKANADAKYVYAAFYFFVAVCVHIVLRRLKVYFFASLFLFDLLQPVLIMLWDVLAPLLFGEEASAGLVVKETLEQDRTILAASRNQPQAHGSFGEL